MLRGLTVMGVAAALVAPAAATAGGFATVGLDPPPAGVGSGDTWTADITVLQHGRTPIDALEPAPALTIRRPGGGEARTFESRPAGRPGVYRTRVVFPAGGRWVYEVDAFGTTHTFAPVRLGGPAAAPAAAPASGGTDPNVVLALAVSLAAGLLAGLLTALVQRRRPPRLTAPAG